jgi:hypothetical protein
MDELKLKLREGYCTFYILTVVTIKDIVLWNVTLYNLVSEVHTASIFRVENSSSKFFRNMYNYLWDYMVSYLSTPQS